MLLGGLLVYMYTKYQTKTKNDQSNWEVELKNCPLFELLTR